MKSKTYYLCDKCDKPVTEEGFRLIGDLHFVLSDRRINGETVYHPACLGVLLGLRQDSRPSIDYTHPPRTDYDSPYFGIGHFPSTSKTGD